MFDGVEKIGTPAQIQRTDDPSSLGSADTSNRRKNTQNEQSMRRTIQDLVISIDPNVKIEPEVEDVRQNHVFFFMVLFSSCLTHNGLPF